MQSNFEAAIAYWTNLYSELMPDCIRRVNNLSNDYVAHILQHPITLQAVKDSKSIIEFGCGTGHLCYNFSQLNEARYFGYDISTSAIEAAKKIFDNNERLSFSDQNILEEELHSYFDLAISSNVIEHFKEPFPVVNKLLDLADRLLLLVPYNEIDLRDGYDSEGGAGHVYSFTENSFKDYKILDWFTFYTPEWSQPPVPLQMSILLCKH